MTSSQPPFTITSVEPSRADQVETVRRLFQEYVDGLGVDLSFQDVAAELASLPGRYAPPSGRILLARSAAGEPVGCIAFRPMTTPGVGEIKRLYVRPEARGHDLGRRLAEEIITFARGAGYHRIVLDTLASMASAQRLYLSLGFQPTEAYYDNPTPGTQYLALILRAAL